MRAAFAGTPEFAARALSALLDAGFEIPLVLTAPDRPSGRGLAMRGSPVKALAESRGLPIAQPPSLKDPAAVAAVTATAADVLVVAAYGLILPSAVLRWPRHGAINVHASLLPRWRGAAPIQRALLAGDPTTGITLMQMDEGLDTGPVIEAIPLDIGPGETAGSLHDRLAEVGARAIVSALHRLERDGRLGATPQLEAGATYAAKIGRADVAIDWTRSAAQIERQVRALAPAPGAMTSLGGEPLKIWRAEVVARAEAESRTEPESRVEPGPSSEVGSHAGQGAARALGAVAAGRILALGADRIDVACGDGLLRVRELQRAGGRRVDAAAYLAGHRLRVGDRLGS
jgi:methionyl-tRNA formyltransferase